MQLYISDGMGMGSDPKEGKNLDRIINNGSAHATTAMRMCPKDFKDSF